MPWPTSQDYNEAVQNPQTSFNDPELRQGQVTTNALGIPQPCSGNFADVYQVGCPDGAHWAVKCFTREIHGLRERYSEISKHLRQARLPFTVDFQYLEQGIRIAGRWYPVLKMHWVEGFTLNGFVRDMLGKPVMLDALAQIWRRMARRLREAKLAHCDLQHGNVLLVPDSKSQSLAVKLIDYDGMWVPALAGIPSGEIGHPAYQHPQRLREGTYGPEVDRFPLLVIYCAIRGLAVAGRELWERYDTGDNLLFRQQDFEAPGRSPLFADLLRLNHPEVRELAVKLIDAARLPIEQTPLLEEMVPNAAGTQPSGTGAKSQEAPTPMETVASPFEGVAGGYSNRAKTAKGRGVLMGALIGAAVFSFACLGLGTLLLTASGSKPSTANQVAKRTASPAMDTGAKPIIDSDSSSQPKAEPIPKVPEHSEPKPETIPKPGTAPNNGPKNGQNEPAKPEKYITNSLGMKLAYIPAGKFMMGQAAPNPMRYEVIGRREVKIDRPFYMGVHEVTQKQFVALMNSNPSHVFVAHGDVGWDWPVERVTWDEANMFCAKLSGLPAEKRAGRVYRLPTEAEWEYAYRAGSKTSYYFDPRKANEYPWTKANSVGKLHPVGQLKPNAWGLYDMHGNVFEWCADKQDGRWHEAPQGWGVCCEGVRLTRTLGSFGSGSLPASVRGISVSEWSVFRDRYRMTNEGWRNRNKT